eukprot:INCI13506.6.p1 GENE.INCI13506.6~~INCI13506.6.p1  ORF type:complete len:1671 (+),score=327.43 INCI13506.6:102-5114(+)
MPRTFTNRPMGVADVKELQKRAKAARLRGDRPTSLRLLQQATQLKEAVFGTESDVAMLAKATTNLAIASAFSDEEQHAQAMRHAQAARQIIEESILPENQVTIERVRVLVKAYVAIGIEYEFSSQWGSALSAYRNARHLAEAYLGGSKLAAQHEKWAKARLHKSHVLQFCHSKMNSQLQSSLPEVHLIRTRDTRTGLAAIEVQRVPRAGPLKQDRQRRGVNKSPEKRRRRPRTASGVSPRSRNATPKIANRPTTAGNAKSRSADKKTRVDFFYPGNGANRESDEASDGANELVPPPFPDGLRFEFSSSNPQSYDSDESDGADDQATVNSGRTMDSSAALQSGLQVLVLTRPGFWSLRNAIRALAVIVAKDKAKSEREQALRAQAIENERREREERERREREALKQQQLAEQKLRARREAQEKFERERAEREEVRRREEAERARKAAEEARLRAEQDAAARREAERQRAEEEEKRQAEESRRAQEELELRRRQERERAAQMDAEMAQRAKVKKLLAEAARERWARLHRDAQLYYNAARKFQSLTRGYLLRKQREKHGTDFVSAHIKLAETAATEAVANKLDDDIICAQAQIAWAWDNLAVKLLQVNPGEHGGTVGGTFELPKQISLVYRDVKLHISDPFVVVEKLIQGGALEAAGAQELDAVLAVDGQQFKNMREFLALVDGKNAMTFQLVRMPEIPILEEFKVAVRRAIVARIRHETELKARAVVALGGALAELPENRAAQGQKRRREETRANAATQIQHLFRSYRADKVLREAHCVDGRVHSVPRELTDVVDAIDESALALNARVAWAWANEKVRSVHIKRGDDWQIAPLSFEAQLPGQVELAYRGMQLALSDPFLLITTLDSTSILCECGIHPGDAVLTVDGEDFSDVATFSKRVAGKREMVWQVVSMDAEIPETELDEHKQRVLTAITLRLHHEVKMRDFFSTQSKGTTIASRTLPLRYEQKALTLNCLRGFLELLPVHTRKAVGNMKLGFHRAPFLCSVAAAVESTGQLAYVDAAQASRATMPDHATWLEAKFKRWQKLYAPKHSDGSPTQSPKSRLRARPTIEFIERHNKIAKLLAQKVGVRRVNVAAEPGNEFVSSLQNTDTLEEYGYERPEITGYGQKLRHLDSLRHFVALERHGHVEQSEHKAKSFVDETVGHVIDQLRRSLKTEEGSDFLDARARCRYARETGKGHYFATVTPLEEEDDVWSGAGALACSGQVPNLHFSMMTDAYNSFGWEPFILDSVYKESPLREHNIVPGDAIVSVNGQSFRTLADFNNLVLAGSSNIVLELVRLDEAEATSKHQADELFAMEAEVSRRASIVALTAFRFGGFKQMAASKLQAAGRGFLLRKKSRTLISGGSSLVADAVTTLDNESPQVQVVAMVERNREKGARKALEKRDQEFVEGAVQFVRSQLAAVVELDSMREQLDTWAILVWARIRDMLKTIQVNQNSATVPLGIDGEVPALFSINFKKLMRLSLSEASFFRVESVANGCALEVEGVKPGDLVLSVNGHGFVNKEEILKQARSSKSLVLEVLPKGAFDRVANDARDHRLVQLCLVFSSPSCLRSVLSVRSVLVSQKLFHFVQASQWSAVRRSVVAELSQRAEAQAKAAAVDALHTSSTAITRIQASARGWVQRQRALEIYHQVCTTGLITRMPIRSHSGAGTYL